MSSTQHVDVESYIQNLDTSELRPENVDAIRQFVDHCAAEGLSEVRQERLASALKNLVLKIAPADFRLQDASEDDLKQLVALSVGAPGNSQARTIEQREHFWYAYFFLFEDVAEAWLKHDDWQLFREWTREQGDQERYLEDLSRPGALTAGLNWHRANFRPQPPAESNVDYPNVTCPVLGVWSDGDFGLTEGHMTSSEEKVDGPWRCEKLIGAGHWLTLDKPAELNDHLVEFVTASTTTD